MVEPRVAARITFVDNYCTAYQHLFPEVRNFEAFKFLHLGMIIEIPRKFWPAIALIRRMSEWPIFNLIPVRFRSIEQAEVIVNFTTITIKINNASLKKNEILSSKLL